MTLLDNLRAYWKLDESSGDAADSSGNGKTLTNSSSIGYSAGLINNCADWGSPTANRCLTTSDTLGIDGGAVTISLWYKGPNPGLGVYFNLGQQINRNTKTLYGISYFKDGSGLGVEFTRQKLGVGSQSAVIRSIDFGSDGLWHHLVLSYDGSTFTPYVDGTAGSTASASGNGSSDPGYGGFRLGLDLGGGISPASIKIDEVGVWDRALSSTEVTTLYNSRTGRQWPFGIYIILAAVTTFTLSCKTILMPKIFAPLVAAVTNFVISTKTISINIVKKWANSSKSSTTWTNDTKN